MNGCDTYFCGTGKGPFLEMQLKKMREILPTFYASQGNKGHHSPLTASLKEVSVEKPNPIKTNNENSNFDYQKTEETNLHQMNCIKCGYVQETSVVELPNQKCQAGEGNPSVCSKCQPSMAYGLSSMIVTKSASQTEKKGKVLPGKMLKTFKTKNFQPDKYYCDKCRFSTKDALQHKKHIARHEKIKFICSQCNISFYTKGTFRRHLVKHTGRFPYQCNHCDYGAVRHDYVVKHTERLHETGTQKQAMLSAAKAEQKLCLPKQSPLQEGIAQGAVLQNKAAHLSFNGITCGIQGKMPHTVSSSNVAEYSEDTAHNQHTDTLNSADVNMIIEVEVFSPKKGPLIPGMPLTVVAPPNFVVPSNSFAQIIEINKLSGTQQLILKFIPLKETTSSIKNYKEAEYGNQCADQGKKTNETMLPKVEDTCVLVNEYHKNFKCPISSSSPTLEYNLISAHNEFFFEESTEKEYDCTLPIGETCDEINYLECFPKGKYQKNEHTNYNLDPSVSLFSSRSESRNESENGLVDAVQENYIPSSFDKMYFNLSNTEKEHWNEYRAATKTHLFDSSLFYTSEKGCQWNTSVSLDESDNVLGEVDGENMKRRKYNHMEFSETQITDERDFLEGPMISSVYSLSNGAVNVPEDIRWNDISHKKKTTSLLYKKIAQLMSADESNMKSQLDASARHDKNKVLSSSEKMCEGNDTGAKFEGEFVPGPQRVNDTPSSNEFFNKQEEKPPPETLTQTVMKKRLTSKMHTTPVFIPPGTVLKVLNFTSGEGPIKKNRKESRFLPRPVPYSICEKLDKHSFLPTENKVNEAFRKQRLLHRQKFKRVHVKNSSQRNSALPHSQCSDLDKPNRAMNEEAQNKYKQLYDKDNLSKKRQRTEKDCFFNVVPSLTRHLRLIPFKGDQLIKCPHHNQPVVVLNHPDVDCPEIINLMKAVNNYKGIILKVVLFEKTMRYLTVKQQHERLTFQNFDGNIPVKKHIKDEIKETPQK